MEIRDLNKLCFTICIVLGSVLGLAMIWGNIQQYEFVWKSWLTIGLFFLAAALTLSVSRTFEGWGAGRRSSQEAAPEAGTGPPREERFRVP